eukprot:TRINITY_DN5805_c0_g2_i1.p1 TRINITY_DN5805_c0_g2~~TRINITY_DN5805_c0_g2_i1.p1  ORF type:complete len:351 (+),score=84.04 TRINITY_DN5805_c0_g2_i1:98-1150(+)
MEYFPRALRGDPAKLRQVYLRLALLCHPDKVQGKSPVEKAAATAKFQAIQAAYDQLCGKSGPFSGKATPRVRSAFAAACELGDLEEVRKLLKLRPESVNEKDDLDVTPLMFAASGGSAAICEILLEARAQLEAKNPLGWTALTWASLQGQMEAVHCLIDKGASISNNDLMMVAFTGRWESFSALLDHCGGLQCILAVRDKLQLGLLHFSLSGLAYLKRSSTDHLQCVELVIAARCDLEAEDRIAAKPVLSYFVDNMNEAWAMNGLDKSSIHQHAIRRLCSLRADPTAKGSDGRSAIDVAKGGGMKSILAALLRGGEEIEPIWSGQQQQQQQESPEIPGDDFRSHSIRSFL